MLIFELDPTFALSGTLGNNILKITLKSHFSSFKTYSVFALFLVQGISCLAKICPWY